MKCFVRMDGMCRWHYQQGSVTGETETNMTLFVLCERYSKEWMAAALFIGKEGEGERKGVVDRGGGGYSSLSEHHT